MALISLNGSVIGPYACELDIFAEVIAPISAKEAVTTWNSGFDGYAVAYDLQLAAIH